MAFRFSIQLSKDARHWSTYSAPPTAAPLFPFNGKAFTVTGRSHSTVSHFFNSRCKRLRLKCIAVFCTYADGHILQEYSSLVSEEVFDPPKATGVGFHYWLFAPVCLHTAIRISRTSQSIRSPDARHLERIQHVKNKFRNLVRHGLCLTPELPQVAPEPPPGHQDCPWIFHWSLLILYGNHKTFSFSIFCFRGGRGSVMWWSSLPVTCDFHQ